MSSSRGGRGHLPSPGELWSVGKSHRNSSSSSTGLVVLLWSSWTGFVFGLLPLLVRFLFGVVASPSVEKSAGACLRARERRSSSLWLYRLGPNHFFPTAPNQPVKVKVAPSCRRPSLEHLVASDSAEPSAVFPLQQNRQTFESNPLMLRKQLSGVALKPAVFNWWSFRTHIFFRIMKSQLKFNPPKSKHLPTFYHVN